MESLEFWMTICFDNVLGSSNIFQYGVKYQPKELEKLQRTWSASKSPIIVQPNQN